MDATPIAEQVADAERRLEQLEELPEPARSEALDAVAALLGLYGEALRRMLAQVGDPGALAADELVGSLLLLHDLHPATLEERVLGALEEVRPYMGSHGGGVELVEIADGVVRVRLEGTCTSCAASTVTLRLAIEEAVLKAVPEVHAVEAVEDAPAAAPVSGTPLPMVPAGGPGAAA